MSHKVDEIIGMASLLFANCRDVDRESYIDGFLGGVALGQKIEKYRREGNSEDQIVAWLLKMLEDVQAGNGPSFPTLKEKRIKRAETN
ncbi:hypothetical protein LCGC14_2564770 [marine sediment metagenome]|uniref:Uncharacterized protein n=1 Tax=marine sediment metagenome TaxID=412755 RepID=A0A0F9AIV9_9ZZZZ